MLLLIASIVRPWSPPFLSVPVGTQVTCTEPVWNAGVVFSGQSRRHEFIMTNTGRTAVTVKAITASCGCTTYSQELLGKRVEAGERLAIPVTWNVAAQPGPQHKQVGVHFEEWPKWTLPLQITGEVKAAYTLSSPQLSFGTIASDAAIIQEATITFAEGAPSQRITSAQCSHNGLNVAVEDTDNPCVQKIVVATVPPLTAGRLSTNIILLTDQGSLVLPVVAAVESRALESTVQAN